MVRKKILLVEDDQELQLAIAIRLKRSGFDVKYAKNSPAAISLARQEDPDLIVLGPGLTEETGDEFERRLGATPATSPFMEMTGSAASTDSRRHRRTDVLRAPVDQDELVSRVEDFFSHRAQSSPIPGRQKAPATARRP